jgi:hypothetical protein
VTINVDSNVGIQDAWDLLYVGEIAEVDAHSAADRELVI